ncbi:EpsG family protein [Sphingopyxis sp. 550A]
MIRSQEDIKKKPFSRNFGFYYLIFLIFAMSALVGFRDSDIGTDYNAYMNYYKSLSTGYNAWEYEFLFQILSKIISFLGFSYNFYIIILFITLNSLLICLAILFHKRIDSSRLFLLYGFLLSSNWYLAATLNGLRQGLSLPIAYIAIYFFSCKRYIFSTIFFIISFGMHKSSVMIIPFVVILFANKHQAFLIFVAAALGYYFGITDIIFNRFSMYFESSFYDDVVSYGSQSEFYGFNIYYFIYTFAIGVVFYFSSNFFSIKNKEYVSLILKIYILLCMPYFFFAHGGYSNRFAFMSWLFIPFMYASFFDSIKISKTSFNIIAVVAMTFGLIKYVISLTFGII